MIRSHGLSIDTTTQSTTLEFNSSFLYLHHIKVCFVAGNKKKRIFFVLN